MNEFGNGTAGKGRPMNFVHDCRGGIKDKDLGLWSRRGLLANVSVGVSVQLNALVAGNGSYILRPCGHDLHGPTTTTYGIT